MKLRRRKPTRLQGYDYSTPGAYFITICTHNRKELLSEIVQQNNQDVVQFPKNKLTPYGQMTKQIIEMLPERFNISIPNYVIMPNHIHLIIEIGNHDHNQTICNEQNPVGAIHESPENNRNIVGAIRESPENNRNIVGAIRESPQNNRNIVGAIRESPLQGKRRRTVVDKAIGFLKMNVSKEMHKTYNEEIWQRSYHDHIIRDEKDYRKIWEYIDTNVLRWKNDCFYT